MKEKYGIFHYIEEGEKPLIWYMPTKKDALLFAEQYSKSKIAEEYEPIGQPYTYIEVLEKDEDGKWGNSGEPILRINIGE